MSKYFFHNFPPRLFLRNYHWIFYYPGFIIVTIITLFLPFFNVYSQEDKIKIDLPYVDLKKQTKLKPEALSLIEKAKEFLKAEDLRIDGNLAAGMLQDLLDKKRIIGDPIYLTSGDILYANKISKEFGAITLFATSGDIAIGIDINPTGGEELAKRFIAAVLYHELIHASQARRPYGKDLFTRGAKDHYFECFPNLIEVEAYYREIEAVLSLGVGRLKDLQKAQDPRLRQTLLLESMFFDTFLNREIANLSELRVFDNNIPARNYECAKPDDSDKKSLRYFFQRINEEMPKTIIKEGGKEFWFFPLENKVEKLEHISRVLHDITLLDNRYQDLPHPNKKTLTIQEAMAQRYAKKGAYKKEGGYLLEKWYANSKDNSGQAIVLAPDTKEAMAKFNGLSVDNAIELRKMDYPASYSPSLSDNYEKLVFLELDIDKINSQIINKWPKVILDIARLTNSRKAMESGALWYFNVRPFHESQENINIWQSLPFTFSEDKKSISFSMPPIPSSLFAIGFTPSPEKNDLTKLSSFKLLIPDTITKDIIAQAKSLEAGDYDSSLLNKINFGEVGTLFPLIISSGLLLCPRQVCQRGEKNSFFIPLAEFSSTRTSVFRFKIQKDNLVKM